MRYDKPGMARRLLADWLAPAFAEGTVAKARLMVSELVTNAVRHGHGTITLRADLCQDRLRVEVADEGPGFQREARTGIDAAEGLRDTNDARPG